MAKLYKVVLHTTMQQEGMQNRWYYLADDDFLLIDLLLAFLARIADSHAELTSADVSYNRLTGERIDGDDQSEVSITLNDVTGQRTVGALNTFDAWGFRMDTPTKVFRAGGKRVSGIAEQSFIQGFPEPGMLPFLSLFAFRLHEVLTDGGNDAVNVLAKLNAAETLYLVDPITNASFTTTTTQNTRKISRGSGSVGSFNIVQELTSLDTLLKNIPELVPFQAQGDQYNDYLDGGGDLVGGELQSGLLTPFV